MNIGQYLLNRRATVLLMLGTLHLALAGGLSTTASRALLVSHFGVFLLWQPVFRRDSRLSPAVIVAIAVCGTLLLVAGSAWLVALWIIALIGTIGGRVFTAQMPRLRLFYQFALGYLLVLLLFWVVPVLVAEHAVPANLEQAVRFGLPLLLAIMFLLPLESSEVDPGRVIDFVYGLLFFLLVSVLVLATLAFTKQAGNYYLALLFTILGVGIALLILGVLWNPSGGYSGLQLVAAASKRFDKLWVGGFIKYDDLSHAVFADSPLAERRNNVSAGIAVAWIFAQSQQRVAPAKNGAAE